VSFVAQAGAILLGALAGLWLCRSATGAPAPELAVPETRLVGFAALALFMTLLVGVSALGGWSPRWQVLAAFYRSGALVFGGGHVVLPLLNRAFVSPGWITEDAFLDGYGAAQAMPGPLFAFAAYLGARISVAPHGIAGALLGIVAIFLPGILLLMATLPFCNAFRFAGRCAVRSLMGRLGHVRRGRGGGSGRVLVADRIAYATHRGRHSVRVRRIRFALKRAP
jgi:chromate transporter